VYERNKIEKLEEARVARPPSPFDVQYADDMEVYDEEFRQDILNYIALA
jgi:hypothetical protein